MEEIKQKSAAYMQKKARQEAEGIRYIREKLNWNDIALVAQVYENLLKKNTFETPKGREFLAEMRKYLEQHKEKDKNNESIKKEKYVTAEEKKQKIELIQKQRNVRGCASLSSKEEKSSKNRLKNKSVNIQKKEKETLLQKTKRKLQISFFCNIILLLIVIGMFWISSTSQNPTILDYETKLINKYEDWEKNLQDREKKLQEKEKNFEKKLDYLENGNERE